MAKTEREPTFTLKAGTPAHLGALVELQRILSSAGDLQAARKLNHAIRELERWKTMHRQGV
jgi:hypothetical protein